MPMRLLSRLCCAQLPVKLDDQEEIQKCELLRSAGLIEAELPPVMHERGRTVYSGQAIVMCVTPRGQSTSSENAGPGHSQAPRAPCHADASIAFRIDSDDEAATRRPVGLPVGARGNRQAGYMFAQQVSERSNLFR